jgi:aminobenzoyl-glutamate utilization protein B
MQSNLDRLGPPPFDEADRAKAAEFQATLSEEDIAAAWRKMGLPVRKGVSLCDVIVPLDLKGAPMVGSTDVGDVSWVVPTVQLRYPANMASLPGHHWSNAMAMATPIAHKGIVAGAKVLAATVLDLLLQPELISETKRYFTEVQTKDKRYEPFIGPDDKPPLDLNETAMQKFRPLMRPFYYDAEKYDTYLEQLGVEYPVLECPA